MKIRTPAIISTLLASTLLSVPTAASEQPKLTCTTADDWTALFDRKGETGWLGADGIYTVALSGNDAIGSANDKTKTFFIFSDTLLGISDKNGKVTRHYTMPNHTSAVLVGNTPDPEKMNFVYGYRGNMQTNGAVNLFGTNQWMFDCLAVGSNIYVLGFEQKDWKPAEIWLYTVPVVDGEPDYAHFTKSRRKISQLLKITDDKHYDFGMGVFNNTAAAGATNPDEYIYFYGFIDNIKEFSRKDMIVSRSPVASLPSFADLEYWNGSAWVKEITESAVILPDVSCEVSVSEITGGPYKGKYIAVYTKGVQTSHMMYAIGDSPTGPFSEPVEFYTAPETGSTAKGGDGTLYTYNAKAHPHLSKDGKLLVSYNVNDSYGLAGHTDDYHPRFLYLDLMYTPEEIAALNAPIPADGDQSGAIDASTPPVDTPTDPQDKSAGSATPYIIAATAAAVAAIAAAGIALMLKRKKRG